MLDATQRTSLRNLVRRPEYAGLSPREIARRVTTPTEIDNPAPQGQVPRPFTGKTLAEACSPANRPKLASFLAGSAAGLIVAQDRLHLAQGLDALETIGVFPAEDVAAMKAVLSATLPDPAWTATVPGPSPLETEVGVGWVAVAEIEEALS